MQSLLQFASQHKLSVGVKLTLSKAVLPLAAPSSQPVLLWVLWANTNISSSPLPWLGKLLQTVDIFIIVVMAGVIIESRASIVLVHRTPSFSHIFNINPASDKPLSCPPPMTMDPHGKYFVIPSPVTRTPVVCDTSLDNGFILSVSQTIDSLLINTTMGYLQSNGYQTHNTSFMVWLLFAGQSPSLPSLPSYWLTNEGLSGVRSGVTCQILYCQTIISTMITNINGHEIVSAAVDNSQAYVFIRDHCSHLTFQQMLARAILWH